jgi:hypothetical protein
MTNNIAMYAELILMAIILWLMIELYLIVNELRGNSISISVFDIDETWGLEPLRSFILLIVSSLYLIVNELRGNSISISVFDIDETWGLKPLRSFILLIVSSYFIIITIFIIKIVPTNMFELFENPSASLFLDVSVLHLPITNSMIMIILMLLLGLMFFIITQNKIRNLIDQGI